MLDDRAARQFAKVSLGLRVVGTIGILLRCKVEHRIDALAPLLQRLLEAQFRLSPTMIRKLLMDAGEDPNSVGVPLP